MGRSDEKGIQRRRLIKAREKRNLSRDDVARELGVSISFVYRVEAGVRNPGFNVMTRWGRMLGVSLDVFRDDASEAA